MNRLLVKEMAMFALLIAAGFFSLIIAPTCKHAWLSILNICFAAVDFILAWLCYRRMARIAKVLDGTEELRGYQIGAILELMTKIYTYGKDESESKTQEQGQAPRQDESEDEYAHPV